MRSVHRMVWCLGLWISLLAPDSHGLNPELRHKAWEARWITHPEVSGEEEGGFLFRKSFSLNTVPADFLIHVSADNRYKLYVNGTMVCYGPSRGDLLKWRFESIDIAEHLRPGSNTLCAVVWNHAELRPVAHFSIATGLIVQGDTKRESTVNTGPGWKVMKDEAFAGHPIKHLEAYYVVGPGETFDARKHPWGWMEPELDDRSWASAKTLDEGRMASSIKGTGKIPPRTLVPRRIPLMEMTAQDFAAIRRVEGLDEAGSLLREDRDLVIGPNRSVTVLLDQGKLTTACPVVRFSGGRGSELKLTYAESLYVTGGGRHDKHNRDEVKGKVIKGNYDIITADGGLNRRVEPLWWRTFRYVQVEINTRDEALTLHRLHSIFTGYPLEEKAAFISDRPVLSDIWRVGWHTQRMCAGEVFYDCPYYEQLQYAGDTRIQGLVTCYVSGDADLWKKSIECFYDSRLPFGLTQSRYPSRHPQIIPTFSLVWVTMCHDYLMHRNDADFIKSMLPAIDDVLMWFEQRLDGNGLPGDIPYWNYVDGVDDEHWRIGVPPCDKQGHSAVLALQYVYTLEKAAELYSYFGAANRADHCRVLAEKTKQAVMDACWDSTRRMVADTPAKTNFSQHANIWAVLVGLLPSAQGQDLLERTMADQGIAQCTYYFRFYLAEALKEAGMADRYVDLLDPWEEMLNIGLSTFAETPDPTRSDCHAWSASPLYHFLSLVAGIEPGSPGFKTVRITPSLGSLNHIDARMPHPNGEISVQLERTGEGGFEGTVTLPPGLEGVFELGGETMALKPGKTILVLPAGKQES